MTSFNQPSRAAVPPSAFIVDPPRHVAAIGEALNRAFRPADAVDADFGNLLDALDQIGPSDQEQPVPTSQ